MPDKEEINDTKPIESTPKADQAELNVDELDRVPSGGQSHIIEK